MEVWEKTPGHIAYVTSTVSTNPSLRGDQVSCIQIAVVATAKCLIVLSVVRITSIVPFPHADHLASCLMWSRADRWVGMFSITVNDGNGASSTVDFDSDIIFSIVAASHLGSLGIV